MTDFIKSGPDYIKNGETPQIPSVSVFCNPRTVDLACTFQEQLIVAEDRFLASRNKNSISQAAAQFFYLLRAAQNNIGCFSHVTKLTHMRVQNKYIIPEQHEMIEFLLGWSICCPISVTGVPVLLE